MRNIEVNFDRSINSLFQIEQLLLIFTLITAASYLYLLIRHYQTYYESSNQLRHMNQLCGYDWPCLFFYSRISSSEN